MKLAIISDIHSNLEALRAILQRLESESIDRMVCLGDVVGYGANPNECIELVREHCSSCVMGNHDAALAGIIQLQYFNAYARSAIEWSQDSVSRENLDYLAALPMTLHVEDVLLVHATPHEPSAWNYIHTMGEAAQNFDAMGSASRCFIGHSHIPARFNSDDDSKSIINVGSVGQPRDRDPRATCGVYDTVTREFDWLRETYDIKQTAERIRSVGLPDFLASRLFIGM